MKRAIDDREWKAYAEEVLAALYAIAGGVLLIADIKWLGYILLIKAGIDTVAAIVVWNNIHRLRKTADPFK